MKNEQSDKPGRDQRLEISLDGSHACALWGANLHDGEAVFVKIEGWPNASHKQEQAAMREAYELLCKAIGDRLPFDIVRDHLKPSVALPELQQSKVDVATGTPADWQDDQLPPFGQSDTPRTDSAAITTEAPVPFKGDFVRVEFARQLERELAEAQRALEAAEATTRISDARDAVAYSLSAKQPHFICTVITGCRTPDFCMKQGPKCAVSTIQQRTYDVMADAVSEVADAANEAFLKAGLEPGEWDGDDIVKDVARGIASDIEALAARSTSGSISFGMNQGGTLDELYATDARLHIEQMSATHWWMAVEVGKKRIDIGLHSKATIKANVSDEGEEPTVIPSAIQPIKDKT